jgi:preprotein translocase subunit SecB
VERTVDFAAIARVAQRSELKSVRLISTTAKCEPTVLGTLVPHVDLECRPGAVEDDSLEVICEYTFTAHANEVQAVSATIAYLLVYEINGGESQSPDDLAEFARANGTLNSWPFVREMLFGLTSRMGYPPYTLPLMHFSAKPKTKEAKGESGEIVPADQR